MLRQWKFIGAIIMLGLGKNAVAQKDSVYLRNGQILIGTLKMAQFGELTIDDVDFRETEIKMYKIKAINSFTRVKIETHEKKFYYGIIKRSSTDGRINFITDDSLTIEMAILDMNTIAAVTRRFIAQIDGNLSAGFSYTKSNSLGQLNLSSNTKYTRERSEFYLSLSMISSIDSSEFSRDRENADLFGAYNLSPTWFLGGGFDYERNLELSIASRFQQLIGAGNKVVLQPTWQLSFMSGLTFNQETSTAGTFSGLLLEVPLVLKFDFFKYRRPNMQITSTQSIYYSLTQKGRARYDGRINFSWEIMRRFYFMVNPYANYDTQPPEGNSKSDFGIAVSISFKY